ncbi:acyl-CoA Delta-9 desaturase [Tribolium madens]|uniref:acyl-CoA Delta-9 desaturase n=1 Tax=Tribolium madens TaxID=41895 RepID=UPI001CF7398E|nr:acyl-CoA Delta-9 desaturase [Tribolium madens]
MSESKDEKLSIIREVDWLCVVLNIQVAISCFCGLHFVVYDAYFLTTSFSLLLILLSTLGVTAGAHRLWAHHSYEATTSLRVFLMLCQTLAGQTSIYNWVRLHRLHHKYFQTELDPFNPQKGFIYSHFIANNLKLSQAQEKLLEEIDMSDLEQDKIVMFQKKYYWFLFVIVTLLLPINAPVEYWDETILNSFFILGWLRLGISYHLRLLIHSGINIFDFKQTDRNSYDSNAVFFVNKSYWISYHYISPWDYQASEYGKYGTDCTSKFIRVCAALELATDLKTVDSQMIQEALAICVNEKKPIGECLTRIEKKSHDRLLKHYLTPSKYY